MIDDVCILVRARRVLSSLARQVARSDVFPSVPKFRRIMIARKVIQGPVVGKTLVESRTLHADKQNSPKICIYI